MQIYMAAMEGNVKHILSKLPDDYVECALISYYYIKDNEKKMQMILRKCKRILVDSGAHSFQHGVKVDFDAYTERYAKFIEKYTDNPKLMGFFEMDVDNVIGVEKVAKLRERLERVSDKIIPVWHHFRGINDFVEMCKTHKGRRVSVTGFADGDILPGQFNLFINTAHYYGCKIHILGFTRFELIKTLNLGEEDSVDSSSWAQNSIFGRVRLMKKDMICKELQFFVGFKVKSTQLIRKLNFLSYNSIARRYITKDQSIKIET